MSAPVPGTPLPWDYEHELDGRDLQRPWIGRLAESKFVALAAGESVSEAAANAAYIVWSANNAPSLLEALKEARGLLNRYRQETPPGHSPHMICHKADEALARIGALLAQATGEA